jgi:hypothetical protein
MIAMKLCHKENVVVVVVVVVVVRTSMDRWVFVPEIWLIGYYVSSTGTILSWSQSRCWW